ncbi:MFS transporter [Mesorhizobium sp. A623]
MKRLPYPLAVYTMVIGAFAVGADEFIVAGVVTEISEALSVSIGAVGRLESYYAIGVAIGAPLFALIALRLPRRMTLIASLVVFVVGNIISAVGPNYETIMAGRLISAAAHGAFLGIAALAAGDMVDPARKGRAIALVFTGVTISTVLGAPLGAAVGRAFGWRFTFWSLVLLGAAALILLIFLLPRTRERAANAHGAHGADDAHDTHHHAEGHGAGSHEGLEELDAHARMHMAQEQSAPIAQQLKALARPPVWLSLLMTMLGYSGVFTSYVYLEPQILEAAGFSSVWVTPLFLLFGLGLFGGNIIGGKLADWKLMPAVLLTISSLVIMLFVMYFAIQTKLTAVIGIFLYGAAAFSVITPLQTRVILKAGDAPNVASAANISALTLGSAIGIWLGGLAIDGGLGAASVNWVGGLLSLSGLIVAIIAWTFVDRRYPDPAT